MARVCTEEIPKGTYKGQKDDGFYMDDYLKQQIDILIKNVTNNWDFTIIITGGGEVRVGKSELAKQIAIYWTHMMNKVHGIKVPFSVETNYVFKWDELIKVGHKLHSITKYCALVYDEAGESLEGTKVTTGETKAVLDYLRECGQYNFLNILVLPEFFVLPRGIALTRSIFLIDVTYRADDQQMFQRGYFHFYSRKRKKNLFLKGKKFLNYYAVPFNFRGRFYRTHGLIDEEAYDKKKLDALRDRGEGKKKDSKHLHQRDLVIYVLYKEKGYKTIVDVSDSLKRYGLDLERTTIHEAINKISKEKGEIPTIGE